MRRASIALASVLLPAAAAAYEQPAPRFIEADVTWRDPKGGAERTDRGQFWFRDLPAKYEDGKPVAFGRPGHMNGIKWFVPKNPGDIWLARVPTAADPQTFLLHDYCGERNIVLAFGRVDVTRTAEVKSDKLLDESVSGAALSNWAGRGDFASGGGGDILGDAEPETPVTVLAKPDPRAKPGEAGAPPPALFATAKDIGARSIAVTNIARIVFLAGGDGRKRETYGGRYVAYSNQAVGDQGRVQVVAATFFGGADPEERFTYGQILADGTILMLGNFRDLGFAAPAPVRVIGTDPPADAYPPVERSDPRRGRTWTEHPRRTVTAVRYTGDLRKVADIARLPWGTCQAYTAAVGPDGALFLAGWPGPHFDSFAAAVRQGAVVENPEAGGTDAKGRKREPGPDSVLLKLSPDLASVQWVVRFKHGGINAFVLPDGRVLARRGENLFFVSPDGAPTPGPALEITGGKMAVDPKSGAIYFGGSYRSGTGLEPYVCPYAYKLDAQGRHIWTAYGWSGPIAGVAQHRLVADSSITDVRVGEDGNLVLTAWSDGGNTVLGYQPYDMRKDARCGGFCSSTWGATGGLTVRIAHIIRMNSETMEVDSFARYVGYLPSSDVPTLINIYDSYLLPNGEVALTGGGWTGFVESQDAWIPSWQVEHRTNEFALAKGGPFFTLFTPDLSRPRMSTITPNGSGLRLTGRGKWLLLYGGAYDAAPSEVGRLWDRRFRTIVRDAVQPENGGGTDGYVALVDTQGPPTFAPPPPPAAPAAAPAQERDPP